MRTAIELAAQLTPARVVRTARARQMIELIGVAALLALVVIAATWAATPQLRVRAGAPDALRYLSGFWAIERNAEGRFRWSQTDATIQLFGLEQRAPVLLQARLSATRKPGLPLVQLTIVGSGAPLQFSVQREWRRYMALLPAPPRFSEGRAIELLSLVQPPREGSHDIGFALDWIAAAQLPLHPPDRLPDTGRTAFLVALGLLGYTGLRRAGAGTSIALPALGCAAIALGMGIARAPGQVAYWLPNLWLALLVGWLALLLPRLLPLLRERQSTAVTFGATLAVGASVALLPLQQLWSSAAGWALLTGGCALLAVALPVWSSAEATPLGGRAVALGLSEITLLALGLRLFNLDGLPLGMWRDESRHGLLALRILNDPTFRPVYVPAVADLPALLFYLAAVPIQLFGAHPWTIRLVPALAGALTPLALYFMARPLFGMRVALLAAALLAVSVWHISLSRLAFAATLGPPLALLAIGFAWRAFAPHPATPTPTPSEGKPAARRSIIEAILAGCAAGLAIYAYHPARLTPPVVAITVAIRLGWQPRAWRGAAARVAVLALATGLVAWPLIRYGLTKSAGFNQRIAQTSIFGRDSLAGRAPAARLEENVGLNLGIWSERGDRIGRHNLPDAPMLDPLTGAAFAIGAGLALARLRDRRALLMLLWLGVALAPGIFSIEAPHAVRTVEVIAPTMLLASLGACALAEWVASRGWRNSGTSAWRALAVGLLTILVTLNITRYFVAWPASPKAYEEFYVAETHAGEVIQQLASTSALRAQGYQIFVPTDRSKNDVVQYLTAGIDLDTFAGDHLSSPAGEHALLIVYGDQPEADQEIARHAIGAGATLLGTGPIAPMTGKPEFVIYGQGDTARQAVTQALARWIAR